MTARLVFGFALIVAASACTGPDEAPGIAVRAEWLTREPTADIPMDVRQIEIIVNIPGEAPQQSSFTVGGEQIRDIDGDDRPELARSDLPTGVTFTIDVNGIREGGDVGYVGRAGPMALAPGERRFVDLKMYQVATPANLDASVLGPRVLHTETSLPDGRVLIAGGFSMSRPIDCPGGMDMGFCFELTATSTAFLFDPTTGRFLPVQGGMLSARGGHTATLLPDGRVLIAGGAERAVAAFLSQEGGFSVYLVPHQADGDAGALATFEIFDPERNAELQDTDRDGDPGRGGFTGSATDPSVPGVLNNERFFHAAAVHPSDPSRVLLFGGLGTDAAGTYEVYDDRRPGGYGVYDNTSAHLQLDRTAPGAVTLSALDSIWIVGGSLARSNDDLAEIWEPGSDPNGTTRPATETGFPARDATDTADHPEYSHIRPNAVPVDSGTHALVIGWMGPLCGEDGSGPRFPSMGETSILCPHSIVPMTRSYTVDGETGMTIPTDGTSRAVHALAATATLPDGTVVVTGGLASLTWNRQSVIDVYTGGLRSNGAAEANPTGYSLRSPRAGHASAALPRRGVLTSGGMAYEGEDRFMILGATEILYLPQ